MNDESRYAALIKPIRDLAQNWDVDIAHTLEDYLDELDDIRLPVANQGNLNFAEAALLIQGSTSVYSRKVEHLHNLVFQALELISSNREGKVIILHIVHEQEIMIFDDTYRRSQPPVDQELNTKKTAFHGATTLPF